MSTPPTGNQVDLHPSTTFRGYHDPDKKVKALRKVEDACLSYEQRYDRLPDIALISADDFVELKRDTVEITSEHRGEIRLIVSSYVPRNTFYLGVNGEGQGAFQ